MDVKYIPSEWQRMKDGIGDLIGLGRWGKGMIDELKDLSDNLEDAESDIAKYDSDGVISFRHTSLKGKYQALYEDFQVLHRFSGKVGDIVDRTIDQPFYEDMDAFVVAMQEASISNYTTKNRIGATETQYVYGGYGPAQALTVPKTEVSLDDIFSGDTFYGKQMQLEYEAWKELNPDQDFSQKEYQLAAVNTHAFEYESIRSQQESKEFWVQLGALVVIVGATLICPPAGIALGVAYGAMELSSAVSGKDWVSGRELGTGERWFRGLLAPLDIIPGVGAVAKFGSTARLVRMGDKVGQLTTSVLAGVKQGVTQVDNLVLTASRETMARLKSANAAMKDAANVVENKVVRDIIEVGDLIDSGITKAKNTFQLPQTRLVMADVGDIGRVREPIENSHTVGNKMRDVLSRIDGINLEGVSKGRGNDSKINEITAENFGNHIIKGKNGRKELAPNVRYITEENYKYTTDELGRIVDVNVEELILGKGKRNTAMQVAVGREDRLIDDDGGHLIGTQFRGSGDIDNLLAQNRHINRSGGEWYKMETEWANALKEIPPKKVSVKIKPVFVGNSLRPDSYRVVYEIEGKGIFKKIIENRAGG
ncbi:DNA/RNA non-specific endonuclease [Robertmurraya korlensis]|uniref:DNA/RNA non-specific endonuclease n=1 Tax=Robertmurraya korlensis TaxID=519977 RepID=UPI00203F96A9|nr:DNA/RNA non-specific endonuclease [Robertmurraya korlensis]MCM3603315.1 DNA/RNA non-specific endonuclease [Robertmurraya korlensis]